MHRSYSRFLIVMLLTFPIAFAVGNFYTPTTAVTPSQMVSPTVWVPTFIPPTISVVPSRLPPLATPLPTATLPQPVETPVVTPEVPLEPTPAPVPATLRVGIQAGHWLSSELPDELARLRGSTGSSGGGYTEPQITLDMAERVATLLRGLNIAVDVLPATVPPGYQADAFVALHTDGSRNPKARGFKIAPPWRASLASHHLLSTLNAEYAEATGLPPGGRVTINMRGYYAFSYFRHRHAIAKTTPAVILEMGFLTNETDRNLMLGQPDLLAIGIANGIIRYLNERNPYDKAALEPAEIPIQRSADPEGVTLRTAPQADAPLLEHINADQRLIPFQEYNGWYHVVVKNAWHISGWVDKNAVLPTDEPWPLPSANP